MVYSIQNSKAELLTTEEYLKKYPSLCPYLPFIETIKSHGINSCKADVFSDFICGTLLIPDKKNPAEKEFCLSYYLSKNLLVLIEDKKHINELETIIEQRNIMNVSSLPQFLFLFTESLIKDDMIRLQDYETHLAEIEDIILSGKDTNINHSLIHVRRRLLRINAYYQQLSDFSSELEENTLGFFSQADIRHFSVLTNRAERLLNYTQFLREYALQIREMYQSQVDIKQNETMKILTVVTTIFFPLSLVTGWYGMNFKNMPELHFPYSYFILIVICLVIVAAEILIFKKKKWI
ncbi:magnesium transporter CorA family protein [Anaerostipes sp.]|uniref:magnesium transporter CorA family protein n=1 Tax=Anaerostipes sp. TaxID=1872530 RepID=UPI0025BBC970|nr:CorA family divalent cation transporter [Anaerostipes sp.]MBS7009497.1 magnesium transporter CorA [Anaerostipes sp.]